jgi:hypothetical protein
MALLLTFLRWTPHCSPRRPAGWCPRSTEPSRSCRRRFRRLWGSDQRWSRHSTRHPPRWANSRASRAAWPIQGYEAEAGQTTLFETTDVKEVTNDIAALERGWNLRPELPLSRDWEGWLTYFLEGVRVQAQGALADADRLVALERGLRDRLYAEKARPTAIQLIDHLFVNPIVTARGASELLGVTNPAARGAIEGTSA